MKIEVNEEEQRLIEQLLENHYESRRRSGIADASYGQECIRDLIRRVRYAQAAA